MYLSVVQVYDKNVCRKFLSGAISSLQLDRASIKNRLCLCGFEHWAWREDPRWTTMRTVGANTAIIYMQHDKSCRAERGPGSWFPRNTFRFYTRIRKYSKRRTFSDRKKNSSWPVQHWADPLLPPSWCLIWPDNYLPLNGCCLYLSPTFCRGSASLHVELKVKCSRTAG